MEEKRTKRPVGRPPGREFEASTTVRMTAADHALLEKLRRERGARSHAEVMREALHELAARGDFADRLDEALAVKNPDEAVARCWELVKELRTP